MQHYYYYLVNHEIEQNIGKNGDLTGLFYRYFRIGIFQKSAPVSPFCMRKSLPVYSG